jgi:hypothetical protein
MVFRSTKYTTNHDEHNAMQTFVVSVVVRCVLCAPFSNNHYCQSYFTINFRTLNKLTITLL